MAGLAEILDENARLRALLVQARQEAQAAATCAAQAQAQLSAAQDENQLLQAKLALLEERTHELEQLLAVLQRKQTGPAHERFVDSDQQILPFDPTIPPPPRAPVDLREDGTDPDDDPIELPPKRRKIGRKPRRRRLQDLPLPRRIVERHLDPAAVCGKCGGDLEVFGETRSYRLNWVPGHFVVDELVRDKARCPDCPDQGVVAAPLPSALPRLLCGDELLVRVLIDKFDDHLPLNRQVKRMAREGVMLSTAVLSNWVRKGAGLLTRLADAVQTDVLSGPFVQGDDTGFPVQDGVGELRKGRLWAFTDQQQVFYAFSPTKEGQHPRKLLADLGVGARALLDGGSEFNAAVRELGLVRAGCWCHLRRYFFEALPHHPQEARLALRTIRDLFVLERRHRELSPEAREAARSAESKPLVDGFFRWVQSLSGIARPKSLLGKAVTYARNQEGPMRQFLVHPELPLHNNLSELMLRQPIVGRKNWLFAGSEGGAEAACTILTLISSCRLQGINPHAYLVDILARLPDYPVNRVHELIPRYWTPAPQ